MSEPEIDVVGIGNAIVDILARTDDAFLDRHGLAKGSMRLIEDAQARALYDDMGPGVEISGGSAANTIAGIASFGGLAAFIGKVRDDQLGEVFGHDIRSIGVNFATPASTSGPETARCMVLVTPDGERTLNTYLGASVGLAPQDVDAGLISRARITYLEGYLWDPPAAKQAFLQAARLAHEAGRLVALTLSDAFCVDRHRAEFLDLVGGQVDVLFANEAEITSLYEVADFDAALAAVQRDCRLAVLTRSEKGCVVVADGEVHAVPAHRVERLVDATGAGDLFAAGFLFGLTRGRSPVDCARLGALAAAEVISHIGARPGMRLDALAREHGLL